MRRETMHVSHLGTAFMRQCLRKAGFDMSLRLVHAGAALSEKMDLTTVTTVSINNDSQAIFLQAA